MQTWMIAGVGMLAMLGSPDRARAYDIDCAIILCMAGGFPSSAVCTRAYRTMIRRITPWPSLPPFGVCSFESASFGQAGAKGGGILETSSSDYDWLDRTHVIWFAGRSYEPRDEPQQWEWSIRSCDREARVCRYLQQVSGSLSPWPETFRSQGGQDIPLPWAGNVGRMQLRSILIEYGDHEGNMGRSNWISY